MFLNFHLSNMDRLTFCCEKAYSTTYVCDRLIDVVVVVLIVSIIRICNSVNCKYIKLLCEISKVVLNWYTYCYISSRGRLFRTISTFTSKYITIPSSTTAHTHVIFGMVPRVFAIMVHTKLKPWSMITSGLNPRMV